MNEQNSSPASQRRRKGNGYGCALTLALLLVAGLVGAVLWGPVLLTQWTTPTSAAQLVLADHALRNDMLARREAELTQLNSFGWVDEAAGLAHIPINQAMVQLAESGLPIGSEGVSATTPHTETASAPLDLTNVNYQDHVLPIFEQHCAECHGDVDPEEGLKLTTYRAVLNGSQNGPVVVPGDPDGSYLVDMVVSGKMPKRGQPLSQNEIDTIIAWIEAGAPEMGATPAESAPATTPEAAAAEAAPPVDLANVSFQAHVLPIFVQHCSECHGDEEQEEGLKLTTYQSVIGGSQNGAVVEPGDADGSYLVTQVVEGKMPKRGDPLPQTEIDTIIAWIDAGALDN